MQLSDFNPSVVELKSTEKADALNELVTALLDHNGIAHENREVMLKHLLDREELGSTAIGNGVAVPYAAMPEPKIPGKGILVGIGVSSAGVEFESLDGKLVFIVIMIVSGPDGLGQTLELLQHINLIVSHEESLAKLKDQQPGTAFPQFDPPPLTTVDPASEPNVPLWIAVVTAIVLVVVLIKIRM